MTLILAIPAKEGVVIASEGEVMYGQVRWQEKKLRKLNNHCVWGASGESALIQRVAEHLDAIPNKDEPLLTLRNHLSGAVKQAIIQLLQQDFRTQFLPNDPSALLNLHNGDFVFAECDGTNPRILHLLINGTSEWLTAPLASGSGLPFAYALLQKYQKTELDINKASLLAFKVIEEAIEVGSWGLGPPIDVWQITSQGVKNLDGPELAGLEDTAQTLRDEEIQLFLKNHPDATVPQTLPAPRTPRRMFKRTRKLQ